MAGFRGNRPFKQVDQGRQIFLHGVPEDIEIDAEIGVDEPVSHCDYVVPGNAGQFLAGWVGYLRCGFADGFNFLDRRQEQLPSVSRSSLVRPRVNDMASRVASIIWRGRMASCSRILNFS